MSRRPNVLVRAWHALTHREVYALDVETGNYLELCHQRLTGRHVGTKVSPPGDRPVFLPVGGAR